MPLTGARVYIFHKKFSISQWLMIYNTVCVEHTVKIEWSEQTMIYYNTVTIHTAARGK